MLGGDSLCGIVHWQSCLDAALTGCQRKTYKTWVTGRTTSPVTKLQLGKRHRHTHTVFLPPKVDGKTLLSMDIVVKFIPKVFGGGLT